jgi:hypothetical protein
MSDTTITFSRDELNVIFAALLTVRWAAIREKNKTVIDSANKVLTRLREANPLMDELISEKVRDE